MPDDYYVSQYSGEEIDALLGSAGAGSVRYDAAQTLTDEQRQQARTNIAAAPGGFGLGGVAKMLTEADNVDDIKASGWYTWEWRPTKQPAGLPSESEYHEGLMRVDDADAVNTAQTIYLVKSFSGENAGDQCVIQRMGIIDGTWNAWEWVNPPLALGVEYRTTERYLGKPVYVKLVNFGVLPNTTYRVVTHGISNIEHVIKAYGSVGGKNIPTNNFNGTHSYLVSVVADKTDIAVLTDFDASAYSSNIIVKYTKTTD